MTFLAVFCPQPPLELVPLLLRKVVPAHRALLVEFLDLLVDQLVRVLTLVFGPARLHEHPVSRGPCGVRCSFGLRWCLGGRCCPLGFGSVAWVGLLFLGDVGVYVCGGGVLWWHAVLRSAGDLYLSFKVCVLGLEANSVGA